jgi:hypothetical protein
MSMGMILILGCVFLIGQSASANTPAAPALEQFDEGDAPDGTNTLGMPMTAYPSVPARYPTVFTGAPPNGPSHMNISTYFLGFGVTAETEADSGPDADGVNNIQPAVDVADQDLKDDAFGSSMPNMSMFGHCQPIQLNYIVTVNTLPTSSGKAYVNLWMDWNRNGAWGGFGQCANGLANEWIVQNQIIPVTSLGTFNYTTPPFLAWVPPGTVVGPSWLRITISDTTASNDDGSGPPNRWALGETEDYLLPAGPPADVTPTPIVDPTHEPTMTPFIDPTNTPTVAPTVAPTKTPIIEPTMTPTKTPIVEPTMTPTKTPIVEPTMTPTRTPIVEPTVAPTKTPFPQFTPTPPPHGEVFSDLGDAPDTTNSTTSGMTAYVSAVVAQFPTVYNATAPYGPFHNDIRLFNLGRGVTGEKQADVGFDTDGVNNIVPPANIADQDRADDGLVSPRTFAGLKHCVPTKMTYTVTYNGSAPIKVFFNLWSDWNRNGAWGGATQCNGALSSEWAVQNQIITLAPGLNTFTSPAFLPWHAPGRAALWFRMTVSETPAALDNGSGPAGGWKFGETEDYFLSPDLGDAPDSLNSLLVPMKAYGWPWWAWAKFPTVYNRPPPFAPRGPLHQNLGVRYVLGNKLTAEGEADLGPDDDTVNNLVLGPRLSNQDRADDAFWAGVPTAASFKHCQPKNLNYRVTLPSSPPTSGSATAYVNIWIDYNRNGAWGGVKKCIDPTGTVRVANEWAVQNQPLTLTGPGVYNLTTPNFIPYAALWPRPMWLRITISNTPATAADGRGPVGGWEWGETEDYLLKGHTIFADISGTVKAADGAPLPNSVVHLFGTADAAGGSIPVLVGSTHTDDQGHYSFDELAPGSYTLLAMHQGFHPQWFNHVHEQGQATPIVLNGTPVANVNFDLVHPTPPPVHVITNGNVSYNPNGNFGVVLHRNEISDVTLVTTTDCITCPNGMTPTNPRMVVRYPGDPTNQLTLPLIWDPATNTYHVNLTVAMINSLLGPNHSVIEIYLVWECGNETIVKFVGRIEIIDPSGFITDIRTSQPISGATVTLYQVPEWSAKTSSADVDEDTCESNASRNGAWSQAAPQEQGVEADPSMSLMSPTASTQVTGPDGYYGWNVGPGCWYVVVSAPGYASRVSPVVGVPSAVTDLDIQLIQATSQLYLPIITK